MSKTLASLLATGSLLAPSQAALAAENMSGGPAVRQFNLAPPVTKTAAEIHRPHWMILVICIVIFIGVFGVTFYSIFKHRKLVDRKPATFHESTTVEIIWIIMSFLIVIGTVLPATKAVVAMKNITNSDLITKATGYQREWGYDYLKDEGEGISFLSTLTVSHDRTSNQAPKSNTYLIEVDSELVVSVNRKMCIVTTTNDAAHSWMTPAPGVKQDAIPGLVHDARFRVEKVGIYRGQHAELCGREHAFMLIVVRVFSQDDYTKQAGGKKKEVVAKADDPNKIYTLEELESRDEKVYIVNCAACYQPNDKGSGPFPALDGLKIANGPLADHVGIVLYGRGTISPQVSALDDVGIAVTVTCGRNNWGNHTDDLLQLMQAKNACGGKMSEGGAAKIVIVESAGKVASKQANVAEDRSAG